MDALFSLLFLFFLFIITAKPDRSDMYLDIDNNSADLQSDHSDIHLHKHNDSADL